MAMDTEIMGKILTELVLGTSKADSRYVTDEATSKFWDQLEVEVAALPEGAVIDAPSEMPDVPPASAPPATPVPVAESHEDYARKATPMTAASPYGEFAFNPDQLRWPRNTPRGGQWMDMPWRVGNDFLNWWDGFSNTDYGPDPEFDMTQKRHLKALNSRYIAGPNGIEARVIRLEDGGVGLGPEGLVDESQGLADKLEALSRSYYNSPLLNSHPDAADMIDGFRDKARELADTPLDQWQMLLDGQDDDGAIATGFDEPQVTYPIYEATERVLDVVAQLSDGHPDMAALGEEIDRALDGWEDPDVAQDVADDLKKIADREETQRIDGFELLTDEQIQVLRDAARAIMGELEFPENRNEPVDDDGEPMQGRTQAKPTMEDDDWVNYSDLDGRRRSAAFKGKKARSASVKEAAAQEVALLDEQLKVARKVVDDRDVAAATPIPNLPEGFEAIPYQSRLSDGRWVVKGSTPEGVRINGYQTATNGWVVYAENEAGWSNGEPAASPEEAVANFIERYRRGLEYLPGKEPFSVTAGAGTMKAPSIELFRDPKLTGPTPLTVDEKTGRVYGHVATWDTCHIGNPEGPHRCTQPPRSKTGYAYFHVGSLVTAEGKEIAVGKLVQGTVHASTNADAMAALAHYENTGLAVADVRAGEDQYGIWVSGALRPSITPEQIREFRAAPLSGDWRRMRGNLEMIVGLAVNVPGFPIPRPAGMVASGRMMSLVASGMVPPKRIKKPGTEGALSDDDIRYLKSLANRERANHLAQLAAKVEEAKRQVQLERIKKFAAQRKEL